MAQPRFLGGVIDRFSEGKYYVITDITTQQQFTLNCDVQPFDFVRYNRETVNYNVYNSISIYVKYDQKNPFLIGNNTHAIDFNGKRYIIKERMECFRVGFMRYIAEAYEDFQFNNSI